MDVACSDMAGLEHQRKGFHTFVMTGDAIIRTNFNPFKPTRQLSYDSPEHEVKDKPETEHNISNQESSSNKEKNNSDDVEHEPPTTPSSTKACTQNKVFIPGFMRVEEHSEDEGDPARHSPIQDAEDSGIDIRLSGELEDSQQDATAEQSQTINLNQSANIDEPSAKRLATRLYQLDGFKLSDVCHNLCKSDEFTHRVVGEFMSFFDFAGHPLVACLRAFLRQISLEGGMNKDKETVLLHFTRRYLDCNKGTEYANTFHSEDSCHTLVCALILLNTDLHDSSPEGCPKVNRKLFIENLTNLNEGVDFPKQFLTSLYTDIKGEPLVTAAGEEDLMTKLSDVLDYGVEPLDSEPGVLETSSLRWCYSSSESSNPALSTLNQSGSTMKGFVLKKHCKTTNGVKTPTGKRGWKRHFAILKDLKLILLKSDKRSQHHKADKFIDLDNAYATVASYYTKRRHAFTVTTSDGSEYLFTAGNYDSMVEWIDQVNLTSASYSKDEMCSGGSTVAQKRSSSYLALLGTLRHMREQLRQYKLQIKEVGNQLIVSQNELPNKNVPKQHIRQLTEHKLLQQRHLQKYTAYVAALTKHLGKYQSRSDSVTESIVEEPTESTGDEGKSYLAGSRISYRMAVYGN